MPQETVNVPVAFVKRIRATSLLHVESILAVVAEEGTTKIGPVDEAGRSVLRDRLYTVGELLRLNQLEPDPKVVTSATAKQPHIFDFEKSKPHRKKDKEST